MSTFPVAPETACEPTQWLPCSPYVTVDDACGKCTGLDLDNPVDAAAWEQAAWFATRRVFMATGGIYTNCCEFTFHPCNTACNTGSVYQHGLPTGNGPYASALSAPVPVQDGWINIWECSCSQTVDSCMCTDYAELPLPYVPARGVTNITIGGVTLDPSSYTLLPSQGVIIRTDGGEWPRCNSWTDPATEWTVTYTFGMDIPPEAKPLIALYACNLARLCKRQPCDLPIAQYKIEGDGAGAAIVMADLAYRGQLLTGYMPLDDWLIQIRGGRTIHKPVMTSYNLPEPGVGL